MSCLSRNRMILLFLFVTSLVFAFVFSLQVGAEAMDSKNSAKSNLRFVNLGQPLPDCIKAKKGEPCRIGSRASAKKYKGQCQKGIRCIAVTTD